MQTSTTVVQGSNLSLGIEENDLCVHKDPFSRYYTIRYRHNAVLPPKTLRGVFQTPALATRAIHDYIRSRIPERVTRRAKRKTS